MLGRLLSSRGLSWKERRTVTLGLGMANKDYQPWFCHDGWCLEMVCWSVFGRAGRSSNRQKDAMLLTRQPFLIKYHQTANKS